MYKNIEIEDFIEPIKKLIWIEEFSVIDDIDLNKLSFQLNPPKIKKIITIDNLPEDIKDDYIIDLQKERKNGTKSKKQSKKLF